MLIQKTLYIYSHHCNIKCPENDLVALKKSNGHAEELIWGNSATCRMKALLPQHCICNSTAITYKPISMWKLSAFPSFVVQ